MVYLRGLYRYARYPNAAYLGAMCLHAGYLHEQCPHGVYPNAACLNGLGRSAPGLRGDYRYEVCRYAARLRVVCLRVECTQAVRLRALRPSGSRYVLLLCAACPRVECLCAEHQSEIDWHEVHLREVHPNVEAHHHYKRNRCDRNADCPREVSLHGGD